MMFDQLTRDMRTRLAKIPPPRTAVTREPSRAHAHLPPLCYRAPAVALAADTYLYLR